MRGQHAHLEGKLAVFERLQDKLQPILFAGEPQPSNELCEENTGQTSENNDLGRNPTASLSTDLYTDEIPSKSGETRAATAQPKPPLKIPTLPAWDSSNQREEDGVNVFPRLAQYLETQGVSIDQRPHNVFPFLKGKAFQLWQLEAETLAHDNIELTWKLFATFMQNTFGVIAPERQARRQYDYSIVDSSECQKPSV
jgi:hypothetical protein